MSRQTASCSHDQPSSPKFRVIGGGARPPGPSIPGSTTGGPLSQRIGLELGIGSGLIRVRVGYSDLGGSRPWMASFTLSLSVSDAEFWQRGH